MEFPGVAEGGMDYEIAAVDLPLWCCMEPRERQTPLLAGSYLVLLEEHCVTFPRNFGMITRSS